MKLFILGIFITANVFASVTPAQMTEIRIATTDVMYSLGADVNLKPRVLSVRVIDQLGSRVKVQFTYEEEMYGEKTCSYYYDLQRMMALRQTALCGL